VDNNYLDLGMNKSGFVHTLVGGRLSLDGAAAWRLAWDDQQGHTERCVRLQCI
jgi:hypothetical protein